MEGVPGFICPYRFLRSSKFDIMFSYMYTNWSLPFVWMLRDAVQFYAKGVDVENYFREVKRTCNLLLGVGDGKPESQYFRGISSAVLENISYIVCVLRLSSLNGF